MTDEGRNNKICIVVVGFWLYLYRIWRPDRRKGGTVGAYRFVYCFAYRSGWIQEVPPDMEVAAILQERQGSKGFGHMW